MKKYISIFLIATFILVTLSSRSESVTAFSFKRLTLYNRMDIFFNRISSEESITLIQNINKKAEKIWQYGTGGKGQNGIIAVALRPGKKIKLWVDLENSFQPSHTKSLLKSIKDMSIPEVKGGPIAFAIHFSLWGGSKQKERDDLIIPEVWQKAIETHNKKILIPDDVLDLVWRDEK